MRDILGGREKRFWPIIVIGIGNVDTSNQARKRIVAAWMCLLAALALYAPLGGAAWSAHSMACCTGDHCPIAQHHHQKKQAAHHAGMACEHDNMGLGEMTNCSMSCCQDSDRPLVTAVAFVLPNLANFPAAISTTASAVTPHALAIPRPAEPQSPPPRLTSSL